MIQTKECPKCGAEHRLHIKKCGCGHQFGSAKRESEPMRDPMHGCCAYTTGTSRCHYPGTFSSATNGAGPFYCSAHSTETDPAIGAVIVGKSHEEYPRPDWSVNAVRRRYELRVLKNVADNKHRKATKYVPSKPGKDWARRILERQHDGEEMQILAVEFAKDALGITDKEAA